MSPALQAAFRLATTLPSRVHIKQERSRPQPYVAQGPVSPATFARMDELEAQFLPRKEMARILRVSLETIRKRLGGRKTRSTKARRAQMKEKS